MLFLGDWVLEVHEWVFAGRLLFHPMGNLGNAGEIAQEGK